MYEKTLRETDFTRKYIDSRRQDETEFEFANVLYR